MLEAGNLWDLICKRAEATPDARMAVDEGSRSLTFADLRERSERVAAGVRAMGAREGDVVSWQLPTWLESIVLVGALARLRAVQNPILPIYREREVGFVVRQARSRVLIVPGTWRGFDYEAMARGLGDVEVLVCDRSLPEGDASSLPPPAPNDNGAVRWLFYTSGTTADPKGAQHTDLTVMAPAIGMADRLRLVPEDRNALVFPFTHIGGIIWMFAGLLVGFTNVLDEVFFPSTTIDVLRRENVTIAGAGTPFHLAYLNAQRSQDEPLFPNVRVFPGGGAPKPPQLHHDVKRELGGAGIASGYGLTEAPILTMASVDDPDDTLANTEGRALPGVSLRVVDGEIRAKGPQVMRGYLDPSLDAEAFDDEGWFRTGDLGRLDEGGNVVITGRLKDIIIRQGENISAKEVEDLLFTHPNVSEVAVIGLPDPELGERCCAVVVGSLEFNDMVEFLKGHRLANQKIPERLEVVDALPRNPTGKVLKYELRDRFAAPAQR